MDFLRRYLLNPFSNPLLCSAAGSSAIGGGGGDAGGTGGDAGGGGAAPPIATWGPPKTGGADDGGADHRAISDDTLGGEGGGEEDSERQVLDGEFGDDAERGEAEVSETFKQFLDSIKTGITSEDPQVAKKAEKQLKRIYGENQQYREHFESPEAAREVSERLESLGGIEGIETETGEAAKLWNMFGAGDPATLDALDKDGYGEGLVKLFSPYVDRMAQKAPAVYAHKFAKVFMATMNEAPVGGISALAALNQLIKVAGVKESPEFSRVAEVINRINEIAEQEPKTAEGSETLNRKERELKAQEANLKKQALAGKAAPLLSKGAKGAIEARLNGRKLGTEAMKQVTAWTHDEFAKLASKDVTADRNRKALLATGEKDKWLKQIKSVSQRLMPLAAKAALRKYNGISGTSEKNAETRKAEGNSRREAGGGGTSAGTIRVKQAPDHTTVDWERMKIEARKQGKDVEDMFVFDRAYFKKGDPRNLYRY